VVIFDKFLPAKTGIKLVNEHTIKKTGSSPSPMRREIVRNLVKWSSSKNNTIAVSARNFKELRDHGGLYYYSYEMMRLGRLSGEQKFVVKMIADWIYDHHLDPFNPSYLSKDHQQLINKFWDNHRDLMLFLLHIVKDGRYKDLHEGNVMIHPEDESFRLIDLEGFMQGGMSCDWLNKEIVLM
jgi:hypothetical protein